MFVTRKFQALIVLFFLHTLAAYAYGQPSQDTVRARPERRFASNLQELKSDIENLLDNTDFSNAQIGISVMSIETGEYFYKRNDTKNFIPASTQKLFTTSAALDYLGKNFKFTTTVYLDGSLSTNGEFLGNIIIRGSGDPTMSTFFYDNPLSILDKWAAKLDSMGIKSIRGNIIGDDRYFDKTLYGPGWAWDDMSMPFSAQVNALTINDNKIDILIKPADKIGKAPTVRITPENTYVKIINNLVTVGPNDITQIVPYREPRTNIIELYGTISNDSLSQSGIKIPVTIDNPTLFFLNLLVQSLEKHEIRFRGALLDIDDWNGDINYTELQPFDEHFSPPLKEIVPIINKNSHNLAAEMLLKALGKESVGIGSFTKGIEQVKRFISRVGISPDNISIVDGSGLSRLNLNTPKYQVTLLSAMYRSDLRDIFMNSLALPGKDGTLKNRMMHSRAEKSVYAKTGSMNNVSSLCGYIKTRDNETLAFSIMMMNFTVPESLAYNLQDLICMRLASFSRKGE